MELHLWAGWVASGIYSGSRGVKHFGGNYNLNQLEPRYFSEGLALQTDVSNPFFGQIASGPLAGAQVQRQQLLMPFPDYQTVAFGANNASSSFHSFQFPLERHFAEGLSPMISYTASN